LNKPAFLQLTSDITFFRDYLLTVQNNALSALKKNPQDIISFKELQDTVLAQLILLNRKRAGEVQRIFINTYLNCSTEAPQEEVESSLSSVERELTKKFKRIVIRGKRGRGVSISFTPKIQKSISVLIALRSHFCEKSNEYLFLVPNTENSYIRASEVMRKMAIESGAKNPSALTSTKLRKQVAMVVQLLNFNEDDVEQLSNLMGHSKEIHKSFYRLPDSVFQIAKVSKFLLMMEKGEADQYRGKNFDEIDVNVEGLVSEESDNENTDISDSEDNDKNHQDLESMTVQPTVILDSTTPYTDRQVNALKKKPKTALISKKADLRSPEKNKQKKRKKFERVPWTENQKLTTSHF